jgi:hypothetical protein
MAGKSSSLESAVFSVDMSIWVLLVMGVVKNSAVPQFKQTKEKVMSMVNEVLSQYPHAKKLSVYAIQVECPDCGGICKTLGKSIEPAVNNLLAIEPTIIPREFEMDLVQCNHCSKTFSLPEDAFC